MAVAIESLDGQQNPLWAQFSWTQRSGGLTGHLGRAPARLTSREQTARCSRFSRNKARPSGGLGGDGYSSTLRRDYRQSKTRTRGPDFQQEEFREVLWAKKLYKLDCMDAQLASLDMAMSRGASKSSRSLLDDSESGRRTGFESSVTAETVSKLCHQGHLAQAIEALGVLVETDSRVPRSRFYAVLKECVVKKDLALGRRVHALTVKKGYESDTFLCNHILRMYASHGKLQDAMDVLEAVVEPDAFMWSSIISAYVRQGQNKQAIQLYHRMRRSSVKPDGHVFVAALQACARGGDLKTGQELHADLLGSWAESDLFVCNCLVDMYAKCGSLEAAKKVFDGLGRKDVVTWNAMLAGYSQQGMGHKAFGLYTAMQEEGLIMPDTVTFVCLLQACASMGAPALGKGKQLHAQIRERGNEADSFVASSLVNMYAKCGSVEYAQALFDGLGKKDVTTWNAMIAGYSLQGMGHKALQLYSAMQQEGIAVPNSVTFVCLLQACVSVGTPGLEDGKQLHAHIRERGHGADEFIATSLVNMYAKCGSLKDAQRVFDGLGQKDVVMWTAMIAGYSQQGMGQEALGLYSAMQEEGIAVPDSVTFVCLLQACASVGAPALEKGRQLHTQIREGGHQADVLVANSLVNMYAKCGSLEDAQRVFDGLGRKDIVTWIAIIAGYSQQGMGQEALQLYKEMQQEAMFALDPIACSCLLQACATVGSPALETGKQLHMQIAELGHETDMFVANSLVNMYAKCGSLEDAQSIFDGLGRKEVVTWNGIIAAYAQQGMVQEALDLFIAMQEEGIARPDSVTFVCLLQACATVAALHLGRQLHAQIKEEGLQDDLFVAGSLINMYGKSGSMVDARQVFNALPEKDVVTWSALIAGYASQGDSEVVFDLLRRMRKSGLQPVGITFISILTACSHASLVSKGREYFDAMSRDYGISPTAEHYTCMVDLLGRAGHLDEALAVVRTMPIPPTAAVWHTLLGACQKWNNVEVGRHAFDQALKLDKADAAAYVLMSNIYTGARMWEQAQKVQAMRKGIRAWKQPGQSLWADMDGVVHSFVAGDDKHSTSQARLNQLLSKVKEEGSVSHLDSCRTPMP